MPKKLLTKLLLRRAQKHEENKASILYVVQEVARRVVREQQQIINRNKGKIEENEDREGRKEQLKEHQALEAICTAHVFLHSNTVLADIIDPSEGWDFDPETKPAQLCLNTAAWLGDTTLFDTFYSHKPPKEDVYGIGPSNHIVGPLQRPLLAATHQGHKRMVQHLLKLGAYPWVDEAFRSGNLDLVKLILSHRHPNYEAREIKLYALPEAAKSGSVETLNFVLKHPAFTPSKSPDASLIRAKALMEALGQAVCHGHEALVRILLDYGADPNDRRWGFFPLLTAAGKGYLRIVQLLLERGAQIHRCVECRYIDPLMKASPCQDAHSVPPLSKAIGKGWLDVVYTLLDAGASMCYSPSGLKIAAENGFVDVARALLERGFDVDAEHAILDPRKGGIGREAMFAACQQGQVSMVRLLAEWGCDVKGRFGEEEAMVVVAKQCGHDGVVDVLVELGVQMPEGFGSVER